MLRGSTETRPGLTSKKAFEKLFNAGRQEGMFSQSEELDRVKAGTVFAVYLQKAESLGQGNDSQGRHFVI